MKVQRLALIIQGVSSLPPPPSSEPGPPAVPPPPPMPGPPSPPVAAVQGWALVTLAAAVAVAASIFMEWGTEELFEESRSAGKVPVQLLWDTVPASLDDFPLMWPLLLGAVLLVVGAVSKAKGFAVVGGVVSLAVSLLYVNAIRAVLADPLYFFDVGLMECIGIGTWVCLVASIVGLVGGVLHAKRPAASPSL